MKYLTFDKYKELGGKIDDESAFNVLERKAEYKLNHITFDRLKTATTIPSEAQDLITLYVDMLNNNPKTKEEQLTSYSNGVESFGYSLKSADEIENEFINLAKEYLGNTNLLYRGGVTFENL